MESANRSSSSQTALEVFVQQVKCLIKQWQGLNHVEQQQALSHLQHVLDQLRQQLKAATYSAPSPLMLQTISHEQLADLTSFAPAVFEPDDVKKSVPYLASKDFDGSSVDVGSGVISSGDPARSVRSAEQDDGQSAVLQDNATAGHQVENHPHRLIAGSEVAHNQSTLPSVSLHSSHATSQSFSKPVKSEMIDISPSSEHRMGSVNSDVHLSTRTAAMKFDQTSAGAKAFQRHAHEASFNGQYFHANTQHDLPVLSLTSPKMTPFASDSMCARPSAINSVELSVMGMGVESRGTAGQTMQSRQRTASSAAHQLQIVSDANVTREAHSDSLNEIPTKDEMISSDCDDVDDANDDIDYGDVGDDHEELPTSDDVNLGVQQKNRRQRKIVRHQCKICGSQFTHGRTFNRHLVRHEPRSVMCCRRCQQECSNYPIFVHHKCHVISRRYQIHLCRFCPLRFNNFKVMQKHMKSVHSVRTSDPRYVCQYCRRGFVKKVSLHVHLREHAGDQLVCLKCGYFSKSDEDYEAHMSQHQLKAKFSCSRCNLHFDRQQNYKQHMLGHDRYDCAICHHKVSSKKALKAHCLHVHKVVDKKTEKQYSCSVCEKIFSRPGELRAHVRIHTGEKPLSCPECQISFRTLKALTKHKGTLAHNRRVGTAEKELKHLCSVCGKVYFRKQALQRHMRYHTAEKPYKCKHCDYRCQEQNNLKRHEALHFSQRNFVCEICGDAFHTKRTLETHNLYRHSDVRKFQCENCNLTFKTNSSLRRHARIHVSARPFKCHVCNTSFNRQYNLRRHLRKVHGSDDVLPPAYRVKVLDADEKKLKRKAKSTNQKDNHIKSIELDVNDLPSDNVLPGLAGQDSGNVDEQNAVAFLRTLAPFVAVSNALQLPNEPSNGQMNLATGQATVDHPISLNSNPQLSTALLASHQAILSHLQLQENKHVLLHDMNPPVGVAVSTTTAAPTHHVPLQLYTSQTLTLPSESPANIITLRTVPTVYSLTENAGVISSGTVPGPPTDDKASAGVVWFNQV